MDKSNKYELEGVSPHLLPNNVYAIVDIGVVEKDRYIEELIKYKREQFDKVIYVNYSLLEGKEIFLSTWEKIVSIGIKGETLQHSDQKINTLIEEIPDKEFKKYRKRIGKDYYTKEDLKEEYKELKSKKDKFLIQKLVELVVELAKGEGKKVIIYNEPELYLDPVHNQYFIKALHQLVDKTENKVILITKEPIILQDIPKECVYKYRGGKLKQVTNKTFGENVSNLTDSILELNIKKSYFYKKVEELVKTGEVRSLDDAKRYNLGGDADLYMKIELVDYGDD